MALTFFGKDPNSTDGECPTVWFDDTAQEFVIQGWKADEALQAKCLDVGPIPESEAVVRVPARMAHMIMEAVDAAERAHA
ncbi:hypothetical protein [Streptomyces sp. NPDC048248]|uniref:hypothetical protein n=1 Tax=Streptomyces sp. NPDC048248 TaxID=3365523 RepID=UPI003717A263